MEAKTYEQGWSAAAAVDRSRARLWRQLRTRGYQLFNDETLIRCARNKDNAAFDALVARYRDHLYTMAVRSLGDEGDADDALCEMFVSAYKDIYSWGASAAPSRWLMQHGLRAVYKRMRAKQGRYAIEGRILASTRTPAPLHSL